MRSQLMVLMVVILVAVFCGGCSLVQPLMGSTVEDQAAVTQAQHDAAVAVADAAMAQADYNAAVGAYNQAVGASAGPEVLDPLQQQVTAKKGVYDAKLATAQQLDLVAAQKLATLQTNTIIRQSAGKVITGVTTPGPFGLPVDVPTILVGLVGLAGVLFGAKKKKDATAAVAETDKVTAVLSAVTDGVQLATAGKVAPATGGVTAAISQAATVQGVESDLRAFLESKGYLKAST